MAQVVHASIPGMGQRMLRLRSYVCPIPGMLGRARNLNYTRLVRGSPN